VYLYQIAHRDAHETILDLSSLRIIQFYVSDCKHRDVNIYLVVLIYPHNPLPLVSTCEQRDTAQGHPDKSNGKLSLLTEWALCNNDICDSPLHLGTLYTYEYLL